jgi:hypothetical protein
VAAAAKTALTYVVRRSMAGDRWSRALRGVQEIVNCLGVNDVVVAFGFNSGINVRCGRCRRALPEASHIHTHVHTHTHTHTHARAHTHTPQELASISRAPDSRVVYNMQRVTPSGGTRLRDAILMGIALSLKVIAAQSPPLQRAPVPVRVSWSRARTADSRRCGGTRLRAYLGCAHRWRGHGIAAQHWRAPRGDPSVPREGRARQNLPHRRQPLRTGAFRDAGASALSNLRGGAAKTLRELAGVQAMAAAAHEDIEFYDCNNVQMSEIFQKVSVLLQRRVIGVAH